MPETQATTPTADRRERFRSFMKRFNPAAPARAAIGDGLIYQYPGRSVFKKLSAGADLTPGSQQLIVGGIGSGKTTELLLAERELSAHTGTVCLYVDVSAHTDLSAVNSGALLASLGLRLEGVIRSKYSEAELGTSGDLAQAFSAIKEAAYGHEEVVWEPPYPEPDFDEYEREYEPSYYHTVKVPGKLKPPFPALRRDVKDLAESVSKLTKALKDRQVELVASFDGLDRLMKPDQFWSVTEQDLRAMRSLGFSVLAAGPLSVMYGQGRQIKDYFDEVHYLPPAIADPKESSLLLEILRLRGAAELMDDELMQQVCLASGGVLRDLVSLARNAGENAYLDDADLIQRKHVDRAIDQLGKSYLLGLGTPQIGLLKKLLSERGFSPSDPASMELLITRRVLEQSESRYEVHPALASVLGRTVGGPE